MRLAVPMVLSAVVVILAVSSVAQISHSSGPYRRTVDRGYAALAAPLVAQSNAAGVVLFAFLHDAGSLGRLTFFSDLDSFASDASSLQRQYDAITPPDPSSATGCSTAIAERATAISTLRTALERVLGGTTGLGAVDEAGATASVESVGTELQSADASWAACRRALRRAPGSALVPTSTWVRDPAVFAGAVNLVSALAGSHSLATVHHIVVLAVVTEPSPVATGSTLVTPATTSVVAHVVLANQGNVDEVGVELGGEVTLLGATASPVVVQRTIDLGAGRSTTMMLPALKVEPGSSYTLQVVAESPQAPGTGALDVSLGRGPGATDRHVDIGDVLAADRRAGPDRDPDRGCGVLVVGGRSSHGDRGLPGCRHPDLGMRVPAREQGTGHVLGDLPRRVRALHHRRVLWRRARRGVAVARHHPQGGQLTARSGPMR